MILAHIGKEKYRTEITLGSHKLIADEPNSLGGKNIGPDPYSLLLASLGACVAMTLRMYADRKEWNLDGVIVELSLTTAENKTIIHRRVTSRGDLEDSQIARLTAIASKCPISNVLVGDIEIESLLA